ncbi:MAG TPA: CoA-binding protein [Pyrinomonadaceae bacterium]|nr:CoA-binding protein [Pyrinomonadaceae bacterium]
MSTTAGTAGEGENWRDNLIEDSQSLTELLRGARRVAVLGMRTEEHSMRPAFYVPHALHSMGLEVIPVPVHHPEAETILGQKTYKSVADVPGEIDIVDVFRRAEDIDAHLEDILAARPKAVWFQSGIRNGRAAERLARAGIKVVQDRCLMVDYRRMR